MAEIQKKSIAGLGVKANPKLTDFITGVNKDLSTPAGANFTVESLRQDWAITNEEDPRCIPNKPEFAPVATSGAYSDLTGVPDNLLKLIAGTDHIVIVAEGAEFVAGKLFNTYTAAKEYIDAYRVSIDDSYNVWTIYLVGHIRQTVLDVTLTSYIRIIGVGKPFIRNPKGGTGGTPSLTFEPDCYIQNCKVVNDYTNAPTVSTTVSLIDCEVAWTGSPLLKLFIKNCNMTSSVGTIYSSVIFNSMLSAPGMYQRCKIVNSSITYGSLYSGNECYNCKIGPDVGWNGAVFYNCSNTAKNIPLIIPTAEEIASLATFPVYVDHNQYSLKTKNIYANRTLFLSALDRDLTIELNLPEEVGEYNSSYFQMYLPGWSTEFIVGISGHLVNFTASSQVKLIAPEQKFTAKGGDCVTVTYLGLIEVETGVHWKTWLVKGCSEFSTALPSVISIDPALLEVTLNAAYIDRTLMIPATTTVKLPDVTTTSISVGDVIKIIPNTADSEVTFTAVNENDTILYSGDFDKAVLKDNVEIRCLAADAEKATWLISGCSGTTGTDLPENTLLNSDGTVRATADGAILTTVS